MTTQKLNIKQQEKKSILFVKNTDYFHKYPIATSEVMVALNAVTLNHTLLRNGLRKQRKSMVTDTNIPKQSIKQLILKSLLFVKNTEYLGRHQQITLKEETVLNVQETSWIKIILS